MLLEENEITEETINKKTHSRTVLIQPTEGVEIGAVFEANFSVEKVLDEEDSNCFLSDTSLMAEVRPSKHAFIISDISTINFDTFVKPQEVFDFEDIKEESKGVIYQLPMGVDTENDSYDEVMKKVGIDTLLSWFDDEKDPFMRIFNEIHKIYGNDPKDFILKK